MGSSALAQNYERERTIPSEQAEAQAATQGAAAEAERRKEAETREVTYEQILADPDNVELNYRYARTQVLKGDLKGSAATLERVLMIRPDFIEARLFHAIVLFRLDALTESEREFTAVEALKITDELRREIESYLRQIRLRRKSNHLSARLSVGYEYDTNRNASPSSGQLLFADIPLGLTGTGLRRDDTSILAMGSMDLVHDLDSQAGHQLFGSLNYYRQEQTLVNYLDLQAYSAAAGGIYKTKFADFTPSARFDHILLSQSSFLRSRGGRLQANRKVTQDLELHVAGQYAYHDYVQTQDIPQASQRSGGEITGALGANIRLSPTILLFADCYHVQENAAEKFNAYRRESLVFGHTWLLGKGFFLLDSITGQYDLYSQPDLFISEKRRIDKNIIVRAGFGVPLSLISPFLKDIVMTFNYEYYHAFSNLMNYEYLNHKIYALATYRLDL